MATEIKVWEIVQGHVKAVEDASLASEHLESDLETWIAESPDILGERLLVIDRQREIEAVGRLDLLCIDPSGKLVIIELKRDRTPGKLWRRLWTTHPGWTARQPSRLLSALRNF